jgi:hypothetical protein
MNIKQDEAKSLSGQDIYRMLNGQVNIVVEHELQNYNNIDELLGPYNALVLLYELVPNNGHWVSMFRNKQGELVFYDPLGIRMDGELAFVNDERIHDGLQPAKKQLTRIVNGEPVISNTIQIQDDAKNINTCGRYAVLRLLKKDLSNDEFNKLFLDNQTETPDYWVTYLTDQL